MASDECTVTMDGPAGSGKTTVARRVAEQIGYLFLDTGAMYRAATLAALEAGVPFAPLDETAAVAAVERADLRLDAAGRVRLGDRDPGDRIRSPDVTRHVSALAALPGVRALLTGLQREFGRRAEPGLVAEGRDMATVVFPRAAHRFYLDASVEVRAGRRLRELARRGLPAGGLAEVAAAIRARDAFDSGRAHAPLRIGTGVTVIDTDALDVDGVVRRVVGAVRARRDGVAS